MLETQINRLTVVLCSKTRPNFLLTRKKPLQRVCSELGLDFQVCDLAEAGQLAARVGEAFWIPNVTYRDISPSIYRKIREKNVVIITGGDECLNGNYLQPAIVANADYYVVYDKATLATWQPILCQQLLFMPQGYDPREIENPMARKQAAVYIGSPFEGRRRIIKALVESGGTVDIFGPESWNKTEFAHLYKGYADNADYYELIAKYRIFLALTSGATAFDTHPNAKLGDGLRSKTMSLTEGADIVDKDFGNAKRAIIACASVQEFVQQCNRIFSMTDTDYEASMDAALKDIEDTPLNYLVSMKAVLASAMQTTPTKERARSHLKCSFTVRFLKVCGFLKIDEPRLAQLVEITTRHGFGGASYVSLVTWVGAFGKRRRFPSRHSLLVYSVDANTLKLRPRLKPHDTVVSPDVKALALGIGFGRM